MKATQSFLKMIPSALRAEVSATWLVGSAARGDATSSSDVDILLQVKPTRKNAFLRRLRKAIRSTAKADSVSSYGGGGGGGGGRRSESGRPHFIVVQTKEEHLFPERIALA